MSTTLFVYDVSHLIHEIKRKFSKEVDSDRFEIIFFPNHFSEHIVRAKNPIKEIKRINKKVKADFYVYGDVRKRKDARDGDCYFIHFEGYVFHNEIPVELSNHISKDISNALPAEVYFPEINEYKGFKTTAGYVHIAAIYILGIAAHISDDSKFAFQLHNRLKNEFNSLEPLPSYLVPVKRKIPEWIALEALVIALNFHKEENSCEDSKRFIQISIQNNDKDFRAYGFKAFIDFECGRNISQAIESVNLAQRYSGNNYSWRYSATFLAIYEGNYEKGIKLLKKIKNQSYTNESQSLSGVREHVLRVLNIENKPALYFYIGYLSYHKEKNLANALTDFEKFEQLADSSMQVLIDHMKPCLVQIKKEMGISD